MTGLSLLLAALALFVAGCADYSRQMERVYSSMASGDVSQALQGINRLLGVSGVSDIPSGVNPDTPLLLLERGMLLHATGNYRLSARDLREADSSLEVLDLTGDTLGQISRYLFSDDKSIYKAAAYEKVLINTYNMLNYLAMGDLNGARIEARRLLVVERYLEDYDGGKGLTSIGAYLAGFTFERSGEYRQAMRFYGLARERGSIPGLDDDIRRLHARTGVVHPSVADVVKGSAPGGRGGSAGAVAGRNAEVLVLVHGGLAPRKVAVRENIGQVLVWMADSRHHSRMSADEWNRAQRLAAEGLLKWLVYPGMRKNRHMVDGRVRVSTGGRAVQCGLALNVENMVLEAHREMQGVYMLAALSRMVARAAAGAITGAVARKASDSSALGFLVKLGTEGAMLAADTPDTRSWSTLPAKVYLARLQVEPGHQVLEVVAEGRGGVFRQQVPVEVAPGGFQVVSVATMR